MEDREAVIWKLHVSSETSKWRFPIGSWTYESGDYQYNDHIEAMRAPGE